MTRVLPPFSSAQLTQLSRILGDTDTGSELNRLLREARLPESELSTKWRRLRDSFEREQERSGSANGVARFLKLAIGPESFVGNPEVDEGVRAQVNKVIGFSGLRLEPDGQLVLVRKTTTVRDAEQRADWLRAKLTDRSVHPDVLKFCQAELLEKNFFHAVLEASKSLFEKIRTRTGLEADGTVLIDQAFNLRNPALMFNDLSNDTERSEQRGLADIARGLCGVFRNPPAHAPRIKWAISELDALDMLTTASMLHRRVDDSRLAPGAPAWQVDQAA